MKVRQIDGNWLEWVQGLGCCNMTFTIQNVKGPPTFVPCNDGTTTPARGL